MGCLSKKGQYPSIGPPTYQIIKVTNANHMGLMKTSLTIIPMCPRERFSLYKSLSRLVLCYKRDWATLLHIIYTCYPLQITLSQNYLLPIISVLAETTLLKTAYHFLLLLVGFDTLTYQKDYDRSPILVGHRRSLIEGVPNSFFWVSYEDTLFRFGFELIRLKPFHIATPNFKK